ncbi:MAG: N-acetylmuramoyl-L-alanine amidase [Bacilli bacterium]|nr:N-acetylmuramoyl-L-alanine amidase [Bacilli bacterium]
MKKYYLNVVFTFFLMVFFLSHEFVFAFMPLFNKTIILDIGHGGLDPGSMYQDIYEKDINLAIGKELESELKKMGAKVIMVRQGDYDLSQPNAYRRKKSDFDNRIKLINESQANYYFSIHLNYLLDSRYYGPQIFYNNNDEKNKEIALKLQTDLNQALKTKREVKKIPSSTYMYSKLNVPGVLIECGFLSNSYERNLLKKKDYQKRFAKIVAESIKELKF